MSSGEGERKSERARERESLGAWESGRRRDEERYFFSPALPLPIPHPRSFKRDRINHRVRYDFLDAFGDNSFTRLQSADARSNVW